MFSFAKMEGCMKKLSFIVFSLAVSFGLGLEVSIADTYSVPQELSFHLTPPSKIKPDEYKPEYDPLLDKFYPIGWGKDGSFAFIEEPADEACGCYFFEFNLIDKEGNEIYQWKPEEPPETGSVAQMWKDNEALFKGKLAEYAVRQERFKLLPQEFNLKGKKFTVSVKQEMKNNDFVGTDVVFKSEFFLNGKSLFTKTYGGEYDLVLEEKIIGVLVAESEEKAAIVVGQEWRGYEGPPNVVHFYFIDFPLD